MFIQKSILTMGRSGVLYLFCNNLVIFYVEERVAGKFYLPLRADDSGEREEVEGS